MALFQDGLGELICLLKQFVLAQHWLNDSAIIDPLTRRVILDLLDLAFFLVIVERKLALWVSGGIEFT